MTEESQSLRRACTSITLICCVAVAYYLSLDGSTLRTAKKGHDASWNVKKGHDNNIDACVISMAMELNPLNVSTYFWKGSVTLPNSRIPHVSSALCSATGEGSHASEEWFFVNSTEPTRAIFAFKAARVGSTFFTQVIENTMRGTKRPTTKSWEPFAGGCDSSPTYEEDALNTVLTHNCRKNPKCFPNRKCSNMSANEYGPPVHIVAANPRFFSLGAINWYRVFQGVPEPRIFSLRRTNLMLMGYSKFHHGGCAVDTASASLFRQGGLQPGNFTFDTMLMCVEHYALGDQEISSSVAFQVVSASGAGARPFLVVYEDVTANGPLVQKEILRYLGLEDLNHDENGIDIFEDNAKIKKAHTDPFCGYVDVNCTELKEGLQEHYPCLLKQLTRADEGLVWSVPMLSDGTISVKGDCHPLEPLSEKRHVRSFEELYQLPR